MDVIELFAGVGGFRVGLNRVNEAHNNDYFNTVWSNQFEPATKEQHASRTYIRVFGAEGHVNADIASVNVADIPQHQLLVGGFPCQDYSVAHSLSTSKGIEGKKGVLWWQIVRILEEKGEDAPDLLFLENVDRLVQSPAKQRGRDYAIILQSLADLGYNVEWRIINAADYGMPQRRRRTYILAYKQGSTIANQMNDATEWLFQDGVFAHAFPIQDYDGEAPLEMRPIKGKKDKDLADVSENFNKKNIERPFSTAGVMVNGSYCTYKVVPIYDGERTVLNDIIARDEDRQYITEDFYLTEASIPQWEAQKGGKTLMRTSKDGHTYKYSEGSMSFPDPLDAPSRTIITAEGGTSPSRFKHVIRDPENNRLRRLIPLELERLDMFPDNHTIGETDTKRAFFMGNALVCGVITKVGEELYQRYNPINIDEHGQGMLF